MTGLMGWLRRTLCEPTGPNPRPAEAGFGPLLELYNHSTVIADGGYLRHVAEVVQGCVREHMAPAWWGLGAGAEVVAVEGRYDPASPGWPIVITDDQPQAGALGWHAETELDKPFCAVFAKTTLEVGGSIAEVIDHEVKETVLNSGLVLRSHSDERTSWALEACDQVQGTGTKEDGLLTANFLYPSAFDPGASGPYDVGLALGAPFTVTDRGWALRWVDGRLDRVYGASTPAAATATRPGQIRRRMATG